MLKLYAVTDPGSNYDEMHSAVIYAESKKDAKSLFLENSEARKGALPADLDVTEAPHQRGIVMMHII